MIFKSHLINNIFLLYPELDEELFILYSRCLTGNYRKTHDTRKNCKPCDCNGHGDVCNEVYFSIHTALLFRKDI